MRTFKTMLTLSEPGAASPPRRPAEIFGLSPPAHAPAPRPGTAVPAPRIVRTPAPDATSEDAEPITEAVPETEIEPRSEVPDAGPREATVVAVGDGPTALAATDGGPGQAGEPQPDAAAGVTLVAENPEPEEAQAPRDINVENVEPTARLGQMLRKAGKKKPRTRQN